MGEAANGKDAMDQIEKLQPQIVISDVVMPLMDGVDFTVAVHHRYPHIQMIILSGYDNFEYVKQTLMQGVVDYILKPTLTPHELLGVLQKAAARIPGWHPDHAMTGETAEELLKELLLGETKTGEELQKVFAASYYCMYAVTIAHGSERAAETAELLCEKYSVPKVNFRSTHLFSSDGHPLPCSAESLQTELWGLSKDKTTCRIPWVFRISVKSETHGFAFRTNIRYGSSK